MADALIKWVEGLDTDAQQAVEGVTLMNEPAHMNGLQKTPFVADTVLLNWLASAADLFRKSKLPGLGVKLYVNMIETSLSNFWGVVPNWWSSTFSQDERLTWAVLDIHWYTAWSGGTCDGSVRTNKTAYTCDQDEEEVRQIYRDCAGKYAQGFKKKISTLKACTEFSAGTFHDASIACNDEALLQIFLEEQVAAFQDNGIQGFFWTWKMPYGPTFQRQWSLKTLLGQDELRPPHPCDPLLGVV